MKKIFAVLALSLSLTANSASATTFSKIDALGPGDKIAGMDISVYQHPGGAPIDFNKMYDAGIRFIIIKGGDSIDKYDAQSLRYMTVDRKAAQAAHMYTSFYYYARLPNATDSTTIIADAKAQAQKVIWRIASLGGYNRRDLPVALDLENNCTAINTNGACFRSASPANASLWAQTWLDTLAATTGKKPFMYSYPQFLESAMSRSSALRQYPLWLARYSLDPALTTSQPNAKGVGCYADSWSNADCTTQWQIWQYTSCGIAGKYGVPGSRVDLNVFYGNNNQFLKLVHGQWQPDPTDMLPLNEATTMNIMSQTSKTTNDPVVIKVNVYRPDISPVVTGTINFTSASSVVSSGTQALTRDSSGSWTLKITGLAAGDYVGTINYVDQSGTEAPSQYPIIFTVLQGATPTPSPSKSISPKPKPAPVDSCAGQIRN
jgi:GH25 family lysozyme M1 (1,4-beta-N-acetylmuramidase)